MVLKNVELMMLSNNDIELDLAKLVLENQELKEQIIQLNKQIILLSEENRRLESQVFGGSTF